MRLRVLFAVLFCMGCPPPRTLDSTLLPVTYDVDDPRCVPDGGVFAPRLLLVGTDGGSAIGDAYLLWDVVDVRVEGLPPCWDVDLAFQLDQGGLSNGRFHSGYDGVVSTARDAPDFGTWSVADPDGPLWSMAGDEGGSADVTVSVDYGGPFIEQTLWTRRTAARDIDTLPIRGYKGVFGDLFIPAGRPPFPMLLVLGDAEGGSRFSTQMAKQFASEGYLSFAVAYFDASNPALPAELKNISLEYFDRAVEVMQEHPTAQPGHLGVVGSGRGGEAALLIAAGRGDVRAAVSIVGSGVSWPSFDAVSEPSWLRADSGVTFLPRTGLAAPTRKNDAGQDVLIERALWTDSLAAATPAQLEAATTQVERVNGAVLLLASEADDAWPSCPLSQIAWSRLRDAGHDLAHPDDAYDCAPNAGHAMNPANVGLPMGDAAEFSDDAGVYAWGGTAQGLGQANRRAYDRVKTFLERTLK